jgi:hypothetical protein
MPAHMLATSAMACTDWKAVAAFDIAARTYDGVEASVKKAMADKLYKELEDDRIAAIADKCQENAR